MTAQEGRPDWRTVEATDPDIPGHLVNVKVGVIEQGGVLHIAIRVGTETVLLPLGPATQLITNLRRVIDYKLQADS